MRAWRILVMLIFAISGAGCGEKLYKKFFLETHEVTQGEFHGFSIGMGKQVTLQKIRGMNASIIEPIPCDDFLLTARNLKEIEKVKLTKGIRVMDHGDYAINIAFMDDHVVEVWRSTRSLGSDWFKDGDTVSDFMDELKAVLMTHKDLMVVPIIPYQEKSILQPQDLSAGPEQTLLSYDAWSFEDTKVQPAGAFYKLYFSSGASGALEKIKYERRRIKLEM